MPANDERSQLLARLRSVASRIRLMAVAEGFIASRFGPVAYLLRARAGLLRDLGAALSPTAAFHLIQGVETLPLRLERHSANAALIADYLKGHPKVIRVLYPGHQVGEARRRADAYLTGGYGGLVGFELAGGAEAAGLGAGNGCRLSADWRPSRGCRPVRSVFHAKRTHRAIVVTQPARPSRATSQPSWRRSKRPKEAEAKAATRCSEAGVPAVAWRYSAPASAPRCRPRAPSRPRGSTRAAC